MKKTFENRVLRHLRPTFSTENSKRGKFPSCFHQWLSRKWTWCSITIFTEPCRQAPTSTIQNYSCIKINNNKSKINLNKIVLKFKGTFSAACDLDLWSQRLSTYSTSNNININLLDHPYEPLRQWGYFVSFHYNIHTTMCIFSIKPLTSSHTYRTQDHWLLCPQLWHSILYWSNRISSYTGESPYSSLNWSRVWSNSSWVTR